MEGKGDVASGRRKDGRERAGTAQVGYLSESAEFLVTPLVHALGRHTQRYSQWGSSSNVHSRYQYSSHRFRRLTALTIRHVLTLSFHP